MKKNCNSQNGFIRGEAINEAKEYWQSKLDYGIKMSAFASDFPRQGLEGYRKEVLYFEFPGEISEKLLSLSKKSNHALYIILLAGIKYLLYRYEETDDVIVGMPIFKQDAGNKYINKAFALRSRINEKDTFKELLSEVRKTVIEADEYRNYPFSKIAGHIGLNIDNKDFPLFNTIVLLENIHEKKCIDDIKADTVFAFSTNEESVQIKLEYNSALFREDSMKRLIEHLFNFFYCVFKGLSIKLSEIDILSEEEKHRIMFDFNNTDREYPRDKTICELFEDQVKKSPHATAAVFKDCTLTYAELNEKSNRLAHMLKLKGATHDIAVAIIMDHSLELLVGIIGVLKAGSPYLPIDPSYPQSRIEFMLVDSGASIVITAEKTIDRFSFNVFQRRGRDEVKTFITTPRARIKDLGKLPVLDRTLIDYEKYNECMALSMRHHTITIQGTRGFPDNCACCHKIWPESNSVRPAGDIFNEVRQYYDLGIRRFSFVDDIFNVNENNSSDFFNRIIKSGMKLQLFFNNGVRGDILTRDYIDLMVEAGLTDCAFALETASPRIQKFVGKNLNIDRFRENLEYITDKYPHVITSLYTMHGFPTETEEEAMLTLNFIKSIKWLHYPHIHILKCYSGTDIAGLATENGISKEAGEQSLEGEFHDPPEGIPFDKDFTHKYQSSMLNEYVLNKDRLLEVLPYQIRTATEKELVDRYRRYLKTEINSFQDLLYFVGIEKSELAPVKFLDDDYGIVDNFNQKIRRYFPKEKKDKDALKVLFLDVSQLFNPGDSRHLEIIEQPLGYMYLLSYLNNKFGSRIHGKIVKSSIDFCSYDELRMIIEDFKPDVIGMRSLTLFKNFFHKTAALIKQWGVNAPIIAGGPYASSGCTSMLRDPNIDLIAIGEGELTMAELIEKMLDNGGKIPSEDVLKTINGIGFVENRERLPRAMFWRDIIMLDSGLPEGIGDENPVSKTSSDNLAYVIYTSGSTGKPKGVGVEHKSLVNLCTWHKNYYAVTGLDRATKYAGVSFDASVWEIFPYLISGSELHVIDEDIRLDVAKLNRYFEENRITISFLPTQICEQMMAMKNLSLRKLLTGGDKLRQYIKNNYELFNNYGPTENTVVATSFKVEEGYANIPIGKPISNTQIFIVNKYNKLQPIGVAGELCISGDSLARGYLKNEELTAEKFLPSSFIPGKRLYKTGDLARWLPDGNIEFMGRIDTQVKIRGYRIELGEIERVLLDHNYVKEALVINRKAAGGEGALCAYLVPDKEVAEPDLRNYLSRVLPGYMIPRHFVQLQRLPITPNGKVDRDALPEPGAVLSVESEFIAPENEMEEDLLNIWKEVLGNDRIGVEDNFFSSGGDSIKAIQIAARLQKCNLKMDVKDLFRNPTVRGIRCFVYASGEKACQGLITGHVLLSPVQRWFFEQKLTDMHHFNMPVMLFRKEGFDEKIVLKVFRKIVEHHDALRMVYNVENGEVVQFNRGIDEELFSLNVIDMTCRGSSGEEVGRMAEKLQASINLSTGPLVKLELYKCSEGDHLLIVVHHLVVDGISWRILLEDIALGYGQAAGGEDIKLQDKTCSFKEWTEKLQEYAGSPGLLREIKYWDMLNKINIAPLPKDGHAEQNRHKDSRVLSVSLSKNETADLLSHTNKAYNTEINDILLAALGLSVMSFSGNRKVLVSLEGHGREGIIKDVDISRTVGWFTSIYPVLLDLDKAKDLACSIKSVKEGLRKIPNKGIGYGIIKYLTGHENSQLPEFNLKPEISFNYLGQFDRDVNPELLKMSPLNRGTPFSPNMERPYVFDITGMVTGGKLRLSINYNGNEYHEATVYKFIEDYKKNLLEIIRHCAGKSEPDPTPWDFGDEKLDFEELEAILEMTGKNKVEKIYQLSSMQEGLLVHELMNRGSAVSYFQQMILRIEGDLEFEIFEKSLNKLIERYDIFRTVFIHKNIRKPRQVVLKERPVKVYFEDISHLASGIKTPYIQKFNEKDKNRGFDLSKEPLMRVAIFKTGAQAYKVIWSNHHILMDGWCLGIVLAGFFRIYKTLKDNKPLNAEKVYPYRNYIKWYENQDMEAACLYWKKYLEKFEKKSVLRHREAVSGKAEGCKPAEYEFLICGELTGKLRRFANCCQVTLNIVFQSIWGVLLQKYNNSSDVVFGSVVSGRPSEVEGIEEMVGLFINTVPVRVKSGETQTFSGLIQQLQESALASNRYEYYPLAKIQSNSLLKQDLFSHVLAFQNYPLEKQVQSSSDSYKPGFAIKHVEIEDGANYDFNMIIGPGKELSIRIKYNELVFDESFIRKLEENLREIMALVIESPDIPVEDVFIPLDNSELLITQDTGVDEGDFGF